MNSDSLYGLAASTNQNVSILVAVLQKLDVPLPSFQQNRFGRYPEDKSVQLPRQGTDRSCDGFVPSGDGFLANTSKIKSCL
jgi:hypothetical protein